MVWLLFALIGVLTLLVLSLMARVARIEERLERGGGEALPAGRPAAAVGPPTVAISVADQDPLVLQELRAGNVIGAIKRYREITGLGLKEAKDAVERLRRISP